MTRRTAATVTGGARAPSQYQPGYVAVAQCPRLDICDTTSAKAPHTTSVPAIGHSSAPQLWRFIRQTTSVATRTNANHHNTM